MFHRLCEQPDTATTPMASFNSFCFRSLLLLHNRQSCTITS